MWLRLPAALLSVLLPTVDTAPKDTPRAQITALYHQYGYILQRRCRRILRDEALVDDAMQEIFLTLCRCHDQYQGEPDKILAWLYRITTTHCLQLLDKDRRWERKIDELMNASQGQTGQTPRTDARLALEAFLNTLPEAERAAVLYRYISGMTQEEIAEVMDVTRDQVRRWLKHFQERGRVVFRHTHTTEPLTP